MAEEVVRGACGRFTPAIVYLFLPSGDRRAAWMRRFHRVRFSFPHQMLMRGRTVPDDETTGCIDVRDL